MVKNLYSVLDSKSQAFGNPFTSVNHNTAIRDFSTAANDSNTLIGKHPTDFILYCIGSFDDFTGSICPCNPIENLGVAVTFKEESV